MSINLSRGRTPWKTRLRRLQPTFYLLMDHGTFMERSNFQKDAVHISTKHPVSNTIVRHCLKFFLRVERGDENDLDSKGNKKQYDIIVEMPVAILSVGATFYPLT
jgi:hypothetical protein